MIEFVRQHVLFLASALVVWTVWSALSEDGGGKKEEKPRLVPVAARHLALRPDETPASVIEDPYRLTEPWSETAAEAGDEEEHPAPAPAPDDTVATVKLGAGGRADEPAGGQAARGPVRLWVDAVLALPGGGRARVCGASVAVGESVPGVDAASPPVLLAVRGTTVDVGYRGERYELSLDAEPLLVGGVPAPPEPEGSSGLSTLLGTLLKGRP